METVSLDVGHCGLDDYGSMHGALFWDSSKSVRGMTESRWKTENGRPRANADVILLIMHSIGPWGRTNLLRIHRLLRLKFCFHPIQGTGTDQGCAHFRF